MAVLIIFFMTKQKVPWSLEHTSMWKLYWGDPEIVTPSCASVVHGLFGLELQAQRKHLPSLEPRRTWIRGLAHDERLSEITCVDIPIGQHKLLFIKPLLLSCKAPLKPPRCITSSLAQDVFYTSISLSFFEPLLHVGSLMRSGMGGFPYIYMY